MQTAFELIRKAATRTPHQVAIFEVPSRRETDYQSLLHQIEAAAGGFFSLGLKPGARVAVALSNSTEAGIVIIALHRAGLIPALLNPRLKPAEVVALIQQGEMDACVIEGERTLQSVIHQNLGDKFPIVRLNNIQEGDISLSQLLASMTRAPALNPKPEDPAFIFYTSGTTGLPKGVVIPHRAAEPRVLFMATQCAHTYGAHNRICGLMPLYHVIGFFAVFLMSLSFNGTLFVMKDFVPADVLAQIKEHEINSLFVTPTHLDALLANSERADDFSSLKMITFAGALMPDSLLEKLNAAISARFVNIYGTSEAMNSLFMPNPTSGSVFVPGFYSETRVICPGGQVDDLTSEGEEGELIVSASNDALFSEYLNRQDATQEKLGNGWYRTSDAAVRLPDGTIQIKGRIDETIISGGENIHPHEIESILLTHSAVADAAVIGVPNDRWGHMVVACVVPKNELNSEALEAHLKQSSLADFKRPRQYHFLKSLPRNATNKIMRKALLQQVIESENLVETFFDGLADGSSPAKKDR